MKSYLLASCDSWVSDRSEESFNFLWGTRDRRVSHVRLMRPRAAPDNSKPTRPSAKLGITQATQVVSGGLQDRTGNAQGTMWY